MTKNRLALGGYPPLPAGRCPGWRFARDDPPSSPADPPGRLPYPQIIPAPSRKHPHAPLHSAGPGMENLGLTSTPPLIFGLYYLKSCNFGVSLTFFVVDHFGRPGRFE